MRPKLQHINVLFFKCESVLVLPQVTYLDARLFDRLWSRLCNRAEYADTAVAMVQIRIFSTNPANIRQPSFKATSRTVGEVSDESSHCFTFEGLGVQKWGLCFDWHTVLPSSTPIPLLAGRQRGWAPVLPGVYGGLGRESTSGCQVTQCSEPKFMIHKFLERKFAVTSSASAMFGI